MVVQKNIGLLQTLVKDVNTSYKEDKQELILFVSFDIVNSSKYKTSNYHNWFLVLEAIFARIRKEISRRITHIEPWRSIGDEIIFILPITSKEQLEDAIQTTFKILNELSKVIKNGDIYTTTRMSEDEINILKQQSILSLKASAWVAVVAETPRRNVSNVRYMSQTEDGGFPCYEFQGNDIDAGFRVSKNTRDRRLTLSFELAYLISENSSENVKLHIISYQRLKGIWDNRLYPIVWYHDDTVAEVTLEDSFYYDEDEEDELIKDYFAKKSQCIRDVLVGNTFSKLDKIAKDRNIEFKLTQIKKCFQNSNVRSGKIIDSNFLQKIHCVAVCKNYANNKILMAKRKGTLADFPNKWEFGCSVVKRGRTFETNLQNDYKTYFNIGIEILKPFKTYSFTDEKNEQVIGVRFIAKIIDDQNIKCNDKYTECKYVNLDNFDELKPDEYVDYNDFKTIIEEVLKEGVV